MSITCDIKTIGQLRIMCENDINGEIGQFYVRDGDVYIQHDNLHSWDDHCGTCWEIVNLDDLEEELNDRS